VRRLLFEVSKSLPDLIPRRCDRLKARTTLFSVPKPMPLVSGKSPLRGIPHKLVSTNACKDELINMIKLMSKFKQSSLNLWFGSFSHTSSRHRIHFDKRKSIFRRVYSNGSDRGSKTLINRRHWDPVVGYLDSLLLYVHC
jgi:hypothetical protein